MIRYRKRIKRRLTKISNDQIEDVHPRSCQGGIRVPSGQEARSVSSVGADPEEEPVSEPLEEGLQQAADADHARQPDLRRSTPLRAHGSDPLPDDNAAAAAAASPESVRPTRHDIDRRLTGRPVRGGPGGDSSVDMPSAHRASSSRSRSTVSGVCSGGGGTGCAGEGGGCGGTCGSPAVSKFTISRECSCLLYTSDAADE